MQRLSLKANAGVVPAKWKIRDQNWGKIVDNELVAPECDAKSHVGAWQIAPIFRLGNKSLKTPVVIHPCKRTSWAAAIRSTSNKVQPDAAWVSRFSDYFRKIIIPEVKGLLDQEGLKASIPAWLTKYPLSYRKQMTTVLNTIDGLDLRHFTYEAFPKVELQFTNVDADQIREPMCDVKERQICGPPAQKKLLANAFINACEKLFSRVKGYCGAATWEEICKKFDGAENIRRAFFEWMDFSGFDMCTTTFEPLLLELYKMILAHDNTELEEPLSAEAIIHCLEDSLLLDINIGRGAVNYKAKGRASGDGWTTGSNTIITAAVLRFLLHEAGVPDDQAFVIGKGDDSVIAYPKEFRDAVRDIRLKIFAPKQDYCKHGLGLICKFSREGQADDLDFVSNLVFRANNGKLRMMRIPARVFESISWSTAIPHGVDEETRHRMAKELCFSKGSCLKAWSRGLPIFEVLADKMMSLGCRGKLTDYNPYADAGREWGSHDDYDACVSYLNERFGISIEAIRRIEQQIRNIHNIYEVVDIPELQLFFD
jgi:hypothetical protein